MGKVVGRNILKIVENIGLGLCKFSPSLLILLFFLFIILISYPQLFFSFSSKIPGGRTRDAQFHISIIEWIKDSTFTNIYHFPIFYPLSHQLASNPPLFLQAMFFKIFQWLGLNIEESNNLYIIMAFLLGAWGCFLLSREFTNNLFIPLFFSSIYIFHQVNFLLMKWLNFVSSYLFPFILFFFSRYLKTRRRFYIICVALFLVLQTLACLYYGFNVCTFFIPLILLSSFVLGLLTFSEIKRWLLYFFVSFLLILFVFYPFLETSSKLSRDAKYTIYSSDLLKGPILFHHSKIVSFFFKKEPYLPISIYYFPGFLFMFFVLAYTVSFIERKRLKYYILAWLTFLLVLLGIFVYINHIVIDYLFLLLSVSIFLSVALSWKRIPLIERVIVLTFFFYSCIFVHFPYIPILKSISIFYILRYFLPFLGHGLRALERSFFLLIPFMVVFASLGAERLLQFRNVKPLKKIAILALSFILLFLENVRYDRARLIMEQLPQESKIYRIIPNDGNQIIIEIPYYFDIISENIRYIYAQRYHRNPILNGKSTWLPEKYLGELSSILTDFPTESKLKLLIENYSVTHVIFHWDLLKYSTSDEEIKKIKERIRKIKLFGEVIFDNKYITILKSKEYFPTNIIKRSYSLYHLKHYCLYITLESFYIGNLVIFLNDHFVSMKKSSSNQIFIDLKKQRLEKYGNKLEIVFDKPIRLNQIIFNKLKCNR